jgi:hypothetical protein
MYLQNASPWRVNAIGHGQVISHSSSASTKTYLIISKQVTAYENFCFVCFVLCFSLFCFVLYLNLYFVL